jgi:hypothetical protein
MTWLTELVSQHSEFESPLSFWKWSALAAISAVVKDQVWLPRYLYNLYPNVYVMLHAESGLKKGPPVSMAARLVSTINNTKVIQGRSSIQGILKELGTAQTVPGGKITSQSTAFICSSELTSSIVDDPVAAKILTDLYDRQYRFGDWASLLKMESFKLNNPTITMLTATNEAMSEDFFDKSAIQGGYFARTFIIYEKEENRSNALMVPPKLIPDYKELANYLRELVKLKGQFQELGSREESDIYTEEYKDRKTDEIGYLTPAGAIYQNWYDDFKAVLKEQQVKDNTGTLNRFGDSVLKVAMLLSLAKCPNLMIHEESMSEAISVCEKLIGNVRRATMGKQGMSDSSPVKNHIIHELLNRETHSISQVMLMKKMWMHYSTVEEFADIMQSFEAAGMIKTSNIGNQIIYEMEPKVVKELKDFLDGKNKNEKS